MSERPVKAGEKEFDSTLAPLQSQLEAHFGSGRIAGLEQITNGWENEVYAFSLQTGPDDPGRGLILRLYPGQDAAEKSTWEYRAISRLYEIGFPVPEPLGHGADPAAFGKPYLLMEKIEGRPLSHILHFPNPLESEEFRRAIRLFVRLHALDGGVISTHSNSDPFDPYRFVQGEIGRLTGMLDRFEVEQGSPMREMLSRLAERSPDYPCGRHSVMHGDYHPENVLLREDGSPVVIDWTGAGTGDYRADLAWSLMLARHYKGIPFRDGFLRVYEREAGARAEGIEYFEMLAALNRLFDIYFSITAGADRMGMRPEAAEIMKRNVGHIESIYVCLLEETAIPLPGVERLIGSLNTGP